MFRTSNQFNSLLRAMCPYFFIYLFFVLHVCKLITHQERAAKAYPPCLVNS